MTGFSLQGTDLRTLALEIDTVDGWDSFPGLKSRGTQYAFTHGEDISGRVFYQARNIDLHMVFLTTDASGAVTTSQLEHLQDNIDTFLGLLHSTHEPLELVRTMPDASTRTAWVRPIDFIAVSKFLGLTRSAVVPLRMGYPFWHGAAANVSGTSPSASNLGNAPVNDMIVTFTTAGRLTHTPTGDYLESAAAGAVVNVGTGEITGATEGDVFGNRPWWLQLEPGANAFTTTGGAKEIDWFHGWL